MPDATPPAADPQLLALGRLRKSPRLAHEFFFKHRHHDASSSAHMEIVDLWHSPLEFVQTEAFRGFGKSSVAEEAIALFALFHPEENIIILGASEERAIERLQAIKYELEHNEALISYFGEQIGETWGAKKCVMRNGTCIQAKGRGQSMRGTKYLDRRPTIAFLDDVEQDDEFVPTEENCKKILTWLMMVVIPAMNPKKRRIRVAGTPSSPFSLTMQLRKAPSWAKRQFPIKYKIPDGPHAGEWAATWPARFSLPWIEAEQARYAELNQSTTFEQEMMLEPIDASQQIFNLESLKVDTKLLRTWHPVYVAYDPARTAGPKSGKTTALTGKAVWSWIGSRLIFWEINAFVWKPDELVKDCFDTDDKYSPVQIGVEQDGLHEFVFQPLRSMMATRGHSLPILPLKAPKGKIDFIKGLQPFAAAGEIIFACDIPTHVKNQFLTFPSGIIDALNAAAFALHPDVRGQPLYQAFSLQNIMPELEPLKRAPYYLALNATKLCTTGVLVQFDDQGCVRVLADWLTDDPPGAALRHIIQSANLEVGGRVKVCAGAQHFDAHDTIGLRAAATKLPVDVTKMGVAYRGREELRALFGRQPGGRVPVQVSTNATWTLRAFNGGYIRKYDKHGQLSEFASEGPYKVLMEGLESLMSVLQFQNLRDEGVRVAYTSDGRAYNSALATATARSPQSLKSG